MGSICNKPEIIIEDIILETKPNRNIILETKTTEEPSSPSSSRNSICSSDTDIVLPIEKKPTIPKSKFFRSKTDESKHKTLEIFLLESNTILESSKQKITPYEVNGKQHNPEDSFNFGREASENHISFPDEKMGAKQFKVKYNEDYDYYSIKDLCQGTGLFVHVNGRKVIEDKNIFCFGNNQMLVSLDTETNCLIINFMKGEYEGKEVKINPEEMTYVEFGRTRSADFTFKDAGVSRNQCSFVYSNYTWSLYDGKPGQPSTNGLWFLANKYVNIQNGLLFKTGTSTFVARVY